MQAQTLEEVQTCSCGLELEFEDCWQCGGEGGRDLYEEDPLAFAPGEWASCTECRGVGTIPYCPDGHQIDLKQLDVQRFAMDASAKVGAAAVRPFAPNDLAAEDVRGGSNHLYGRAGHESAAHPSRATGPRAAEVLELLQGGLKIR